MKKLLLLLLLVFPAQATPKTNKATNKTTNKTTAKAIMPKAGSAERKAIMNALRVPVQKTTKFPVIFRVGNLKAQSGWAFFQGSALHKDGKAIDDKFLWGEMAALLRKTGKTWKVLHWGFATDVSIVDEAKKKYPHAPRGIFPY